MIAPEPCSEAKPLGKATTGETTVKWYVDFIADQAISNKPDPALGVRQ
jgi:hypothetical protein